MTDLLERGAAFLVGDGLIYARRQLRARRLTTHWADDVIGEATVHLVRALDAGTDIDNLEAWLTVVIRRRVVDVLRGELRRPSVPARDDAWLDGAEDPVDDADPALTVIGRATVDDLRAAVARRLCDSELAAAGALAVLAHRDPDAPAALADDCPQPRAGTTETEAAAWAGLFYAGRRNWEGDDAATRKRRSRWTQAQAAVLVDAAAELGLHPGGAGG